MVGLWDSNFRSREICLVLVRLTHLEVVYYVFMCGHL